MSNGWLTGESIITNRPSLAEIPVSVDLPHSGSGKYIKWTFKMSMASRFLIDLGRLMLQQIKSLIRDQLGLPADAVLVVTGCAAHLLLNVLLRKPSTSAWGLLGPCVLGIAIESYEIWVQYRDIGLYAPGNDPLIEIISRHALDVLKMLAAPLVLVVFGWVTSR